MKTAKPVQVDASSSRRAQPVRQTRNNPPRTSLLGRSYSSRDAVGGGLSNGHNQERTATLYPAITYFADAITALPREVMRQFTLLKEVDAKTFGPEEALEQLVDAAVNYPTPPPKSQADATNHDSPASRPDSAPMSANTSMMNGINYSVPSTHDTAELYEAAFDLPRRMLFRDCARKMQEMLVSLDEKNHVISTATEALSRQLARLDDCSPYIEQEISEEARYGSDKHWAYLENREKKPAEKTRRDGGNHASNVHPHTVDEAAARSDARKQALLAKKGRGHHADSDFDDHDSRHKGDSSRKNQGNSRKGRPVDSPATAGLGISNGASVNGNPPAKRRKVEKGTPSAPAMERSLSGVLAANGAASRGKINSPSGTPQPEGARRKAKTTAPTNGNQKKKTGTTLNAMSPTLASSPTPTFAEPKLAGRTSPIPTSSSRPPTAKGRQNSTQSITDTSRSNPLPPNNSRSNGIPIGQANLNTVAGLTGRSISEIRATTKETASNSKGEHMIEDTVGVGADLLGGLVVGSQPGAALKREDTEANGHGTPSNNILTTTITTTKSGRASKPSTPALGSFPDPPVRSRSGRTALEQTIHNASNALAATSAKRSHKKGAGQAAQAAALAHHHGDDGMSSKVHSDEDEMDIAEDEPTYCYCNGVSYGEMVACDADGCQKEWFHLECVGLKVAPKGNAKWYCDDCKENMKSKRFNGR